MGVYTAANPWLLPSCLHASYRLVKGSYLHIFVCSKGICKHNNLCHPLEGPTSAILVAVTCDLEKSSMIVC